MMTIPDEPMPDETARETELLVGLIRTAGRRVEPPDASYRATFDIALAAWHAKTARVRTRRRVGWTLAGLATAAAATIAAVAVTGALRPSRGSATAWPVAAIE